MRRLLIGLLAFLGMSGTILTLPVWAAPTPDPEPVAPSTEEVSMGSVADPAPAADVQEGTTEPVAGVADSAPTLTVSRTGVDEFSLVGVTWAYDPAVSDTVVQVRVQDAAGAWGEWTPVGVEDADQNSDADSGQEARGGTAPLWTGPSHGVEVELVTRAGAQPTDVQLDLVDPGRSEADVALETPEIQDTAHAAAAMPPVYSRAQWGADERLRTWAPEFAPTIKAATLHHTAEINNYTTDQVPAMIRAMYSYHAVSRGWGDIGYNVLVDKFGRLWEGRYGGLASTVIGAHAGGFNTGTFGVSMMGNYDVVDTPLPMIDAVEAIIAWKFALYGVDPRGTTVLTSGGGSTVRYAAGARVTLPTIFGHRDTGLTACPGRYGYARLPEIRDRVTALVNDIREPTISERYAADAALRTLLGPPVGTEQSTAGVRWQQYQNAYMYWTPLTGAHVVGGQIWGVYMAGGGPAVMGAPTTDERGTPDGVGRYNHFANGSSIYWTPSTMAQPVHGFIRQLWATTGWERGPLGYPTSGERAGAGGRFNTFQHGTVYWTAAGGATEVHGDIADAWDALGGLDWAVPTGVTRTAALGGQYNTFAGNRAIYWSPGTGAYPVVGQILNAYLAKGGPRGALGYPTSDERGASGGVRFSMFQDGIIYWTSATGAHVVQGSIARKWMALGALSSGFGVPTTDERATPDGVGRYNHFANGSSIYWTPATGAQSVSGQIRNLWGALGWERGLLRYPTSDEKPTADGRGRMNTFQTGAIFWSPTVGAHAVYGSIYQRYAALGGVTSSLGYPTSEEYAVPGGRASDFEHGRITWTAATGAVTVTTR
ncbi:N-acetylmuramoyl-L-alanine amidase [Geodermatophilus sp. URMC 64]